jgi:deoxyribose-phosphate aldolase
MIEISAVKAVHSEDDIRNLAKIAKQYQLGVIQTLPAHTSLARKLIKDEPDILLGGNIGFPSGAHSTPIKVAETQEMVYLGCDEIDMVINLPKLLSGNYKYVRNDIKSVVDNADGLPVKVIIEVDYLSEDLVKIACDLLIEAGAAYVKTSTGWVGTGVTVENIRLIKQYIGDDVKIKASGNIRSLKTIHQMIELGASRFGVGMRGIQPILKEISTDAKELPNDL